MSSVWTSWVGVPLRNQADRSGAKERPGMLREESLSGDVASTGAGWGQETPYPESPCRATAQPGMPAQGVQGAGDSQILPLQEKGEGLAQC